MSASSAYSSRVAANTNSKSIPVSAFCAATTANRLSLPEIRLLSASPTQLPSSANDLLELPQGLTAGSDNLGQWRACEIITAPRSTTPPIEYTKTGKPKKAKKQLPSVYDLTQRDVGSAQSCSLTVSKHWQFTPPGPTTTNTGQVVDPDISDVYLDWENSVVETFHPPDCAIGMRFNRTDQWQGGIFDKYKALLLVNMTRGRVREPVGELDEDGEETDLEITTIPFTCTVLGLPCDPTPSTRPLESAATTELGLEARMTQEGPIWTAEELAELGLSFDLEISEM